MSQLIRLVLLLAAASLLSVSTCLAADISKGLNCPPGWTDNKSARDNGLIKQCLSPSEKAFINLYLVSEEKTALSEILDRWTAKMKKEGMPLQNMLSESPAHVSGYPAISRSYSGTSQDGAHLKSRLTVSRYHGKNYILQGVYPEGNQRSQELVSHALNIWHYPEASQPPKKHANAKKTSAADAHPGKYKNIGCCWAWGLWKTASGEMVAILPDGRAVFNGNKENVGVEPIRERP